VASGFHPEKCGVAHSRRCPSKGNLHSVPIQVPKDTVDEKNSE